MDFIRRYNHGYQKVLKNVMILYRYIEFKECWKVNVGNQVVVVIIIIINRDKKEDRIIIHFIILVELYQMLIKLIAIIITNLAIQTITIQIIQIQIILLDLVHKLLN